MKRTKKVGSHPFLDSMVIELNTFAELKKIFRWHKDPVLDDPSIYDFEYIEDINERRVRDAEALGVVCRNVNRGVMLEIGTAEGHGTALMSKNAPAAEIFTLNILPEDIARGAGGKSTTKGLSKEEIGDYYRKSKCANITQIYANTATWKPDIGPIDVAFIDGCHDADFVYSDTVKIVRHMKPGSFVLWHDFNPGLIRRHHWIGDVCDGVNRLYESGILKDRIFHVKDSWIGICQIS